MSNTKVSQAEKTLDTIGEWIRGADQKVTIFLALQGIILALLIPNYLKTITVRFQTHTISVLNSLPILLAAVSLGVAVFESLNVILPRVSNKTSSHLYFGGIKNMTLEKYKTEMRALTTEEYFDELCEQIHTNSKIAVGKYGRFQKAIIFFLIGMGLLIVSYIALKFF